MAQGPYSQFITTRHYQLIIRDLYRQPKKVLPRIFNFVVLGSDITTIDSYIDNLLELKPDGIAGCPRILEATKDGIITLLDIYNCHSLLAAVKSGSFGKFMRMFENYQCISLIYDKSAESNPTIFTEPCNLQYFISEVINTTAKVSERLAGSAAKVKAIPMQ